MRLKVSVVCNEQISRAVKFQMAGAEQWKEREPKLALHGWSGEEIVLVRGTKRMDMLVIVDK